MVGLFVSAIPARVIESARVAPRAHVSCVLACLLLPAVAFAGERWTIGLSTNGASIEAVAIAGRSASSPTVLLVGGLQRPDRSSAAVDREVAAFERLPQNRRPFRLMAVAADVPPKPL